MATSVYRGSAKIYEFPAGGRAAFAARNLQDKPAAQADMPVTCDAAFGGAWYHDAAMAEEKAREH
ncbi:DUF2735 domain-containing protein [Methylobrevis pamukkalensis]|uniref:DUF2735 domain-containing protein n=1 Tax=Methylobrevis pamukkalensis TaxID=1439726 RepID=A0A1E3H4M7_9HYPH|nr:DUF2735 domain-containing protein [Methylobrevis pamukkalensis]ODN70471.1 hypothetical protein A6302_02213 [Methylobrevis pamukkalensis]